MTLVAQYNVGDYGAVGDGTTDDTTAIKNAISACGTAGGGIVYFPAGTYKVTSAVATPAQSTGYMILRGAGRGATKIAGTASGVTLLTLQMPGEVTDMTIDGGGSAVNTLGLLTTGTVAISSMAVRRCDIGGISTSSGMWTLVAWDQGSLFQIDTLYLEDVELYGPTNNALDAMSVTYVDKCFVNNMRMTGLARTPNFFIINHLFVDGLTVIGCGTTSSPLVIDSSVKHAHLSHVYVDDTNSGGVGVWLECPDVTFSDSALLCGVGGGYGTTYPRWKFINCDIPHGLALEGGGVGSLEITGGQIGYLANAITDYSPAGTVHGPIRITGAALASTGNNIIFRSFNGTTVSELVVADCQGFSPGRSFSDGVLTSGSPTLTSASAKFSSADVGRKIEDTTGSGVIAVGTTITTVNSATSVTLSANATGNATKDLCSMAGLDLTLTPTSATTIGTPGRSYVRGVTGYNPVGSVTVTVPASGTAVAAVLYDRTFYVTAAATGTTTVAVSGGPTLTLPASSLVAVRVPAGTTLTPTYTAAPTWKVEGE